jgi:hypothetical protein
MITPRIRIPQPPGARLSGMSDSKEYVVHSAFGQIGILRQDENRFHLEFTDPGLLKYLEKRRRSAGRRC